MSMRDLIQDLESLSVSADITGELNAKLLGIAMQMRMCIRKPGHTPRGTPMPQCPQEWHYLGELYEKGLMAAQEENSKLRIQINGMAQRLEKQRRTITGMLETPDEF